MKNINKKSSDKFTDSRCWLKKLITALYLPTSKFRIIIQNVQTAPYTKVRTLNFEEFP